MGRIEPGRGAERGRRRSVLAPLFWFLFSFLFSFFSLFSSYSPRVCLSVCRCGGGEGSRHTVHSPPFPLFLFSSHRKTIRFIIIEIPRHCCSQFHHKNKITHHSHPRTHTREITHPLPPPSLSGSLARTDKQTKQPTHFSDRINQTNQNQLKETTPRTKKSGEKRRTNAKRKAKATNKQTKQNKNKKGLTAPALPAWSPTAVLCWPYAA